MSTWLWVGLAALFFCGGCSALVWSAILAGARHDQRIDDMLDVIGEEGPPPGCDCEDCEDMRQHPPDCACEESCWPAFVQRMRDIAARQAAELDRRRP